MKDRDNMLSFIAELDYLACSNLNFTNYPQAFLYTNAQQHFFDAGGSFQVKLGEIKDYLNQDDHADKLLESLFATENIQAILYLHERNLFPSRCNDTLKNLLERKDDQGETYIHRFIRYLLANNKLSEPANLQNKIILAEHLIKLCNTCNVNLNIKNNNEKPPCDLLSEASLFPEHEKKHGYKKLAQLQLECAFHAGGSLQYFEEQKRSLNLNEKPNKIFELYLLEAISTNPDNPKLVLEKILDAFLNSKEVDRNMVVNYFHFFSENLNLSTRVLNKKIDDSKNNEFIRHHQWLGQFQNDISNRLNPVNSQGLDIAFQSMQIAFAEKKESRKEKGLDYEGYVINTFNSTEIIDALTTAIKITELKPETPVTLLIYDGIHATYCLIERHPDDPKQLGIVIIDPTAKLCMMERTISSARKICEDEQKSGKLNSFNFTINFDKTLGDAAGCAMHSMMGCFEVSRARDYLPAAFKTVSEFVAGHPIKDTDFDVYRNNLQKEEQQTPKEIAMNNLNIEDAKKLGVQIGKLPPSLVMSMQSISRIESRLNETDSSLETKSKTKFSDQASNQYHGRFFREKPQSYREKLAANTEKGVNKRLENKVKRMHEKLSKFISGKTNRDVLELANNHGISGLFARLKELQVAHGVVQQVRIIKILKK